MAIFHKKKNMFALSNTLLQHCQVIVQLNHTHSYSQQLSSSASWNARSADKGSAAIHTAPISPIP